MWYWFIRSDHVLIVRVQTITFVPVRRCPKTKVGGTTEDGQENQRSQIQRGPSGKVPHSGITRRFKSSSLAQSEREPRSTNPRKSSATVLPKARDHRQPVERARRGCQRRWFQAYGHCRDWTQRGRNTLWSRPAGRSKTYVREVHEPQAEQHMGTRVGSSGSENPCICNSRPGNTCCNSGTPTGLRGYIISWGQTTPEESSRARRGVIISNVGLIVLDWKTRAAVETAVLQARRKQCMYGPRVSFKHSTPLVSLLEPVWLSYLANERVRPVVVFLESPP